MNENNIGANKDHPRSRGVYGITRFRSLSVAGSSPLARGLLGGLGNYFMGQGIIPARAGFTQVPDLIRKRAEDHPRSRGVYSASARF